MHDSVAPGSDAPALPSDDERLVALAQADSAAFDALYRKYVAAVYRYLRLQTASVDDARDLTQITFLRALEGLPRYQPRGLSFLGWLLRIARNAHIDATRRRRPTISIDALPFDRQPRDPAQPEAIALDNDAGLRFVALISGLPAEQRELLVLRFVAELPTREIALLVGKSDGAVRMQLSRSLKTLRGTIDARR